MKLLAPLAVIFIAATVFVAVQDANAVIGPSNPTFGPPPGWVTPPPDIINSLPPELKPGAGIPSQPKVGGGESAASREAARFREARRWVWETAFNVGGQVGLPAESVVPFIDTFLSGEKPPPIPPYKDKDDWPRGPLPWPASKPGQWPTCWVNNPPPPPRARPSISKAEIIQSVFSQKCEHNVWLLGTYACLAARPYVGGLFKLAWCEARQEYGRAVQTTVVQVHVCPIRRQAPWQWKITGHVWVDYSPLVGDGSLYQSATYESSVSFFPYRPCPYGEEDRFPH